MKSLLAAAVLIIALGLSSGTQQHWPWPTIIDFILGAGLVWAYTGAPGEVPWYRSVWRRLRSQPWLLALSVAVVCLPELLTGRAVNLQLLPGYTVLLLTGVQVYGRLADKFGLRP